MQHQTAGVWASECLLALGGPGNVNFAFRRIGGNPKCFEICVLAGARRFAGAWGPSKKQSEQLAALAALKELGIAADTPEGEIHITWPKR